MKNKMQNLKDNNNENRKEHQTANISCMIYYTVRGATMMCSR